MVCTRETEDLVSLRDQNDYCFSLTLLAFATHIQVLLLLHSLRRVTMAGNGWLARKRLAGPKGPFVNY
jgi:hypothetical protein